MDKPSCRLNRIIRHILLFVAIVFPTIPFILQSGPVWALGGLLPGDPMVRITAPPGIKVDKAKVLDELSKDVSRDTGLDRSLLTYYWQAFDEINCMGKKADDYPIFVDLYVPGFLTGDMVAKVMQTIASSLERLTGVEKNWVFIHTHTAEQGRVLLSGEVQYFDEPEDKAGRAARQKEVDTVKEEIWMLEEAYFANLYKADFQGVLTIVHSQFLGWPDAAPQPLNKEGSARFMKQLIPKPTSCTFKIERAGIRVLGEVALTQYIIHVNCDDNTGVAKTQSSRITHTWVREGSSWKLLGGMSMSNGILGDILSSTRPDHSAMLSIPDRIFCVGKLW